MFGADALWRIVSVPKHERMLLGHAVSEYEKKTGLLTILRLTISLMCEGFDIRDVRIRLARSDERRRWDETMNQRHYLGFNGFVGRGLRYIAEHQGEWLALAGWQGGVFKCQPRDRWIGWKKAQQFRRLHLIANNTRFLLLPDAGEAPNLGSFVMAGMLRRLSEDWKQAWGHPLELAEAFVEPLRL